MLIFLGLIADILGIDLPEVSKGKQASKKNELLTICISWSCKSPHCYAGSPKVFVLQVVTGARNTPVYVCLLALNFFPADAV